MATNTVGIFGTMVINGYTASQLEAANARSQMARALGKIFEKPRLDGPRRKRLHDDIGRRAQQAVLNAYAQTVTARKRTPSYRLGDRYAGGRLRAAIASSSFYEATPRGLTFINRDVLDREAKHWHRLNFGAGARGGGGRRLYEIRWGGLVAATIGFDDGPSKAFGLPEGFFLGPEGRPVPWGSAPRSSQPFVALRKPQRFPTSGIAARRFLDTGVATIARMLPRAYQDYYREIAAHAKSDPSASITRFVTVSPRPQATSSRRRNY